MLYTSIKCWIYSTQNWSPQQLKLTNTSAPTATFDNINVPHKIPLAVVAGVILVLCLLLLIVLLQNNISKVSLLKLTKSPDIIQIFVLHFLNTLICIQHPDTVTSYTDGFLYMLATAIIILIDAMRDVERWFAVTMSVLIFNTTLFLIFDRIVMMTDIGVILVEFSNGIVIYKRNTQISIFTAMLTLLMGSLIAVLGDTKHERFIFILDHVYRKTGTTRLSQLDKVYLEKRKSETIVENPDNRTCSVVPANTLQIFNI